MNPRGKPRSVFRPKGRGMNPLIQTLSYGDKFMRRLRSGTIVLKSLLVSFAILLFICTNAFAGELPENQRSISGSLTQKVNPDSPVSSAEWIANPETGTSALLAMLPKEQALEAESSYEVDSTTRGSAGGESSFQGTAPVRSPIL